MVTEQIYFPEISAVGLQQQWYMRALFYRFCVILFPPAALRTSQPDGALNLLLLNCPPAPCPPPHPHPPPDPGHRRLFNGFCVQKMEGFTAAQRAGGRGVHDLLGQVQHAQHPSRRRGGSG